jgi:hypothetical protein
MVDLAMKLADEWRDAWKWAQVQLPVLIGTLGMLYGQIDFLQSIMPQKWYAALNGLLCVAMVYNAVRKKDPAP